MTREQWDELPKYPFPEIADNATATRLDQYNGPAESTADVDLYSTVIVNRPPNAFGIQPAVVSIPRQPPAGKGGK